MLRVEIQMTEAREWERDIAREGGEYVVRLRCSEGKLIDFEGFYSFGPFREGLAI